MGIWQSAVRSFLNGLLWIIGFFIGLSVLGGLFISLATPFAKKPGPAYVVRSNAHFSATPLTPTTPVILQIDMDGVIGTKGFKAKDIERQLVASREGPLADGRVKALFIQMNSPGGSADDSYEIYSLIKNYKEQFKVPVYVFVNGLCASGGMMVSCAADQIYAQPSGLIGSVGVRFGPVPSFAEFMKTHGIAALTLTKGKNKDFVNMAEPFDPKKYASFDAAMQQSYDLFVSIVSSARPKLTKEALVQDYGAQIYAPNDAMNLGYIDHDDANFSTVLTVLAEAAKIEGDYQVMSIKSYSGLIDDIIDRDSILHGRLVHSIEGSYPELSGKICYMYP